MSKQFVVVVDAVVVVLLLLHEKLVAHVLAEGDGET